MTLTSNLLKENVRRWAIWVSLAPGVSRRAKIWIFWLCPYKELHGGPVAFPPYPPFPCPRHPLPHPQPPPTPEPRQSRPLLFTHPLLHAHVHTFVRRDIHIHKRKCMHTHIHEFKYTQTDTHSQTHSNTHTRTKFHPFLYHLTLQPSPPPSFPRPYTYPPHPPLWRSPSPLLLCHGAIIDTGNGGGEAVREEFRNYRFTSEFILFIFTFTISHAQTLA